MGTCSTCQYSYRGGDWNLLYCIILKNKYGDDLRVKENGTCNHYNPISTASNSGYSGGGGCFLTSACVDYLGKEDDCYELTTLRKFRDEYLKTTEDGKNLVKNYYEVAPSIVERINSSDKRNEYYTYIYEQIQRCISLIEDGENDSATKIYKEMVEYLLSEVK